MKNRNQRGVSTVELLVVIAIITILFLIASANASKKQPSVRWPGQKSHSAWTCDDPSGCGSRP